MPAGLVAPERTEGGTRRYSANDLDLLRRIGDLLEAGLNLAGIAMVMDLQDENSQLRAELPPAPIPASSSRKRTSPRSRTRSARR